MSRLPTPKQDSSDGFAPQLDRRRLRSARTKQRIIEAFLELLQEGNPNPRVGEIASRAGCAARSIHERFVSVDELHGTAAEYAMNQAIALAPLASADADRQTRITAQVRTRAGTCERALRLWRLLLAGQSSSPGLRNKVTVARKMIGLRLEAMYRPELGTLPAAERHKLLVTLEALTDFESWALMREYHEMSFDDACDIWIGAIDRLLPPTPEASPGPNP
ncbi:TetR/AcrR family transcriptional regulator [Reyranella sp.]|uniref:TetR/AcrR family transcriptional regulator n=1 Tax=Reyranella sp. TaxID=1929291 RepID=UPI003D09EB8C